MNQQTALVCLPNLHVNIIAPYQFLESPANQPDDVVRGTIVGHPQPACRLRRHLSQKIQPSHVPNKLHTSILSFASGSRWPKKLSVHHLWLFGQPLSVYLAEHRMFSLT